MKTTSDSAAPPVPNFVGGKPVDVDAEEFDPVHNPSTGEVIARTPRSSGAAAREFARRIHCGMVGVNIGVPAPTAVFPFSGWGESFFGDLHVQGMEGISFYKRQKVVLSRWDSGYVRKQGW